MAYYNLSGDIMGSFYALICAFFWGVSNVYTRKGNQEDVMDRHMGLFISLFVNLVINLVAITVYMIAKKSITLNVKGLLIFGAAGLLNSFIGRWFLFSSIAIIGASRAGTLKMTSPVFTVLAGLMILGEVINKVAFIGIIVILFGVLLITYETGNRHKDTQSEENTFVCGDVVTLKSINLKKTHIGIILGILSGLTFGTGNLFRKIGLGVLPNPIVGFLTGSIVAVGSSVIYHIAQGKGHKLILALRHCWNSSYMIVGVFSSLAVFSMFFSLQTTPISIASSIAAAEPLFTMCVSLLLEGKKEKLGIKTFASALIIPIGVYLLLTL